MIFATNGIVLRTIKYGETSIISTVFTEIFGVQSYLVNGVRTQKKTVKAHYYQPASLLEMQVYHNDLKNLQRLKEVKWSMIYENVLSEVMKHSIAIYMVELLYKCLKQPEANPDLFSFCEDAFIQLDKAQGMVMANFPLYFSLQLPQFFGFQLQNNYSEKNNMFDIREGKFTDENTAITECINTELSFHLSEVSRAIHPEDLYEIKMNGLNRLSLLKEIEKFYSWNIPDFGKIKSLDILQEVIQ